MLPPLRGRAAEAAAAGAEQVPFVNQEKVTVPVAVPTPPETVAESWTRVPAGTVVTVAWAALWITVVVVEAAAVTVRGSQVAVLAA